MPRASSFRFVAPLAALLGPAGAGAVHGGGALSTRTR